MEEHRIKIEQADAQDKAQQKHLINSYKLRTYIWEAAVPSNIQPKCDDQPHNCFINIEDEVDALSYIRCVEHMDTKYNAVEADRSSAEAYLKEHFMIALVILHPTWK